MSGADPAGASGAGALRCVIVDDNDRLIEAIVAMLARADFDMVGVARGTTEALRLVAEMRPDVALIDLFLDHESGIDLIEEIIRYGLAERTCTILMSTCDEDDLHEFFRMSRADGYLLKIQLSADAIRDILNGDGDGDHRR